MDAREVCKARAKNSGGSPQQDLYTVHGATTDHFYNLMGVLSFTNEMYNPPADFG